jgi:hypothetical protein
MGARRRQTASALVALCAGAVGCSVLLPFDQLDDDPLDAAASLDVAPVDAPSPSDAARSEGAAADAGSVSDGEPTDAHASSDAAVYPDGSWCAAQPTGMMFCDDFDFETVAFERWTSIVLQIGGSASFSNVAESPPHSFALNVPAVTPNTFYSEVLHESVPANGSSLSLSFALRLGVPWDADSATPYVTTVLQGPGLPRYSVGVMVAPDGFYAQEQIVDDGGTTFNAAGPSSTVLGAGQWTQFALDVDFAARKATVTLDGQPAFTLSLQGQWSATATTDVYLGDWYVPTTPAFDLLYDDAVIRQK